MKASILFCWDFIPGCSNNEEQAKIKNEIKAIGEFFFFMKSSKSYILIESD